MKKFTLNSILFMGLGISLFNCSSIALDAETRPEVRLDEENAVAFIESKPRHNLCLGYRKCTLLGANWDANNPDYVNLLISYRMDAKIKQITLIIDNDSIDLVGSQYDTLNNDYSGALVSLSKNARSSFEIPIETVKKIITAKEATLKIELSTLNKEKYYVDRISSGQNKGGGYNALDSILKTIDKV